MHSESAYVHTLQTVYNSGTTPQAAAYVKEPNNFIIAVVDAKHILKACGIQAVSGLVFEGQDADYVPHKALETFACCKFERTG